MPREVQQQIIDKKLKLHVIDASRVASGLGLGLAREHHPADVLLRAVGRDAARQGDRGDQDARPKGRMPGRARRSSRRTSRRSTAPLANLHEVRVPAKAAGQRIRLTLVPDSAPDFVRNVTAPILAMRGDTLPVSALPVDGTYPDRHDPVREAEHRRRGAGLGIRPLHPVRPVRDRLSAQRDSSQVLRREPPRRRAGRASRPRRSTRAAIPTRASRCRSTSKTAPAAACAWRTARRTARPTSPSRRST